MSSAILTFSAAGETWGIPLRDVHEIVSVSAVRRLPLTPECVAGVIDIRGSAVGVVDFARLVGSEAARGESAIVIRGEDGFLALLIDDVSAIVEAKVEPRSTEPFIWSAGVAENATVIDPTRLLEGVPSNAEAGL